MKLGPITDFFDALDDGYYRLIRSDGAACITQWHTGDLIIHQVFEGNRNFSTLAVSMPIIFAYPDVVPPAVLAMIQAPWTPITKSEFVELLDQYLPD